MPAADASEHNFFGASLINSRYDSDKWLLTYLGDLISSAQLTMSGSCTGKSFSHATKKDRVPTLI